MINLLPVEQKKIVRHIRTLRIWGAIVSGVGLLVLICVILLLPTYRLLKTQEQIVDTYTKQLQDDGVLVTTADIESAQTAIQRLQEKIAAKPSVSPFYYIAIIQNAHVLGIRIKSYDMAATDKKMLQIRGVANDRMTLQQFVASLQNDPRITSVDSPVSNFVKSTENEFTISVIFIDL